jgi:hypothetical protein
MRRLLLCSLLVLAGCQNTLGPFQSRPGGRVDDPRLPIAEQQSRGRASLGLPDETYLSGPQSGAARLEDGYRLSR